MADRFFPNTMPEFVPETTPSTPHERQEAVTVGDSLPKLLAMPHAPLSERLKRAALDLKETVPTATITLSLSLSTTTTPQRSPISVLWFLCQIVIDTWGLSGQRARDFTLYCGVLGTAFLLLKSYHVTRNGSDLALCAQIVKACDAASAGSRFSIFFAVLDHVNNLMLVEPGITVSDSY